MQQIIQSAMFRLSTNDVIKGAIITALTALLGAVEQGLTAHGFQLASYDWHAILTMAGTAGVSYLLKNFMSDDQGKVLGKI